MHTPAVKERLANLRAGIVSDDRATPEYLGGFVKSEIEKGAAPIKARGGSGGGSTPSSSWPGLAGRRTASLRPPIAPAIHVFSLAHHSRCGCPRHARARRARRASP